MIRYIIRYFKTWSKPMLVLGGLILFSSASYHALLYVPMLNSLLFLVAIFSMIVTPLIPFLFFTLGLLEENKGVKFSLWSLGFIGVLDIINSMCTNQGYYDLPFSYFSNANNAILLDVFLFPTPFVGITFLIYGLFCYLYRFKGK